MSEREISGLFFSIGIPPHLKGYIYLIYLVKLGAEYENGSFPRINKLYEQTAEHYHCTPNIVEYNVRTLIRSYWKHKNGHLYFDLITGEPCKKNLTTKKFVTALSQYVVNNL